MVPSGYPDTLLHWMHSGGPQALHMPITKTRINHLKCIPILLYRKIKQPYWEIKIHSIPLGINILHTMKRLLTAIVLLAAGTVSFAQRHSLHLFAGGGIINYA